VMDRIAFMRGTSKMRLRERAFQDRRDAGRVLARTIQASEISCDCQDGIVLGLPRGGVPVAYEVAHTLGLPLDIFVVRKLEVPSLGELAMGMVASDGTVAINSAIVQELHISEEAIEAEVERAKLEIERRENTYRNGRPPARIEGRMAILVDDGLATGASMLAAVRVLRPKARKVIVAVPVAANSTCNKLRNEVDQLICARIPWPFYSVRGFFRNFEQTTDEEVRTLLSEARNDQEALWAA
jgi:putative phosphoribosyl transferase